MFKEFREFIARGNVIDLAVGVVIGAAFGKIVTSLVEDVIMPPIGLLIGRVDFSKLRLVLSGTGEAEVAIRYGAFLNSLIQFLVLAFAVFLVVRQINRFRRAREAPVADSPTTRECPFCRLEIPVAATRCGHCTSQLSAEPAAAVAGG